MECLKDGKTHTANETVEYCAKYHGLSPEEQKEKLESGQTRLSNRVGWARTYLSKAGFIEKISRGVYVITTEGKNAITDGCDKITLDCMSEIPAFNDFAKKAFGKKDKQLIENQGISVPHDQSPEEMLEDAVMQLNANLSDDLLSEIIKISPYDFEEIVVKLLIKMGYGKPEKNKDAVTQKSGDEGIDGIVSADKFGFDSIYIQAKQLSHLVHFLLQICKFFGIYVVSAVDSLANLIDIHSDFVDRGGKFLRLRVVNFNIITVNQHLSYIHTKVAGSEDFHLFLNQFFLLIGHCEAHNNRFFCL